MARAKRTKAGMEGLSLQVSLEKGVDRQEAIALLDLNGRAGFLPRIGLDHLRGCLCLGYELPLSPWHPLEGREQAAEGMLLAAAARFEVGRFEPFLRQETTDSNLGFLEDLSANEGFVLLKEDGCFKISPEEAEVPAVEVSGNEREGIFLRRWLDCPGPGPEDSKAVQRALLAYALSLNARLRFCRLYLEPPGPSTGGSWGLSWSVGPQGAEGQEAVKWTLSEGIRRFLKAVASGEGSIAGNLAALKDEMLAREFLERNPALLSGN